MSNFPAISWQEQVTVRRDDSDILPFVLDEYSQLNFYSATSLKQQSTCGHVAAHGHIILIPSQPLFNYSLMLQA